MLWMLFCMKCKFVLKPNLFFLPTFQSELRHGPFYYMKQPLTTDPVDVVPQDGRNDFYCWVCHREGQVLCCELCPRVYHAKCLKLTAEPEGDWFCPECEVSLIEGVDFFCIWVIQTAYFYTPVCFCSILTLPFGTRKSCVKRERLLLLPCFSSVRSPRLCRPSHCDSSTSYHL